MWGITLVAGEDTDLALGSIHSGDEVSVEVDPLDKYLNRVGAAEDIPEPEVRDGTFPSRRWVLVPPPATRHNGG